VRADALAVWAHVVIALLAAWLIAAPATLGYGGPVRTNDRVAGPLIAALGFIAAWEPTRAARRLNLLLGAWLIVAPWILGGPARAMANSMAVGVAIVLLAVVGSDVHGRFGGGWAALRGRHAR
jgi:hypothetical protein